MKSSLFVTVAATGILIAGCSGTPVATPSQGPSPQAAVPQPQPSPEVRDTQRRLQAMGFYNGPVDGLWGADTRAAVEDFQRSRGLPVTAQLDDPTRRALRNVASAPVSLSDPTDVRTVQNRLRQLHYYNGPADGVWGRDTQASVERFQQSRGLRVGQVDQATLAAMGLSAQAFRTRTAASEGGGVPLDPAVVRGVQRRLRQLGYYHGSADGVWGARTQEATERFQRSRGLEPTGDLNPMTASALGLDPNNLELSAVPRR
ncbi:MAG: peptidoglycan-binding protein [Alphaproteobacteria bacterium]|nr:peptidoglycan-binding protein [Alphaproteobacteria bacterium]